MSDTDAAGPLAALPEDAVLVHIGPHKTGTTAIQSTLANSRAELREHGVTYPGKYIAHHREAKSLRQYQDGWAGDADPLPDPAVWTRLAERVSELPGRVIISSEFFAEADAEARAKLVRELGPERVYLLTAARNAAGIAVSTWQQVLRKGYVAPLEDWLEKGFRRTEVPDTPRGFWARADPAALTARWAETIPADRITVVVLDERDRRLQPATFEQLLGLPDGLLADQTPPQANRGLSAVEAALVKQIVVSLESKLTWSEYSRLMRKGVIKRILQVRRPDADEARVALPEWAIEQAAVEGERSIAGLRAGGTRIVGDLEALRTTPPAATEQPPITSVPIDLAAEAVLGAVAAGLRGDWSLDGPRKKN